MNNTFSAMDHTLPDPVNNVWVLVSACLVFLTIPASALLYGGLTNQKNIINVIMMSMVCLGIVTVQWILVGYTFAFGPGNRIWGDFSYALLRDVGPNPNPNYGENLSHNIFAIYHLMTACLAPALICGDLVERMKFLSFIIFVIVWTTLVYDPMAHWLWSNFSISNVTTHLGWLKHMGALDFNGGIVLHLSVGVSALIASIILGKRKKTSPGDVPAHNIPLVWIGLGLSWFGWFGFNGGASLAADSIAIQAVFTTHVAGAVGFIFWMLLEVIFSSNHKPTSIGVVTGVLTGHVAITSGAGFVTLGASVIYGIVGPGFAFLLTRFKKNKFFDDASDVFAIQGVGGFFGAILTGLFASTSVNPHGGDGLFYGKPITLVLQLLACGVAIAVSGTITALTMLLLKYTIGVRVSEKTESTGLDAKDHSETAYKDDDKEQNKTESK